MPSKHRYASDRGQLIVAAGLVLAIMMVMVALVMNGVIFTENRATRQVGDHNEVIEYDQHSQATSERLVTSTNTDNVDNASYDVLQARFDASMINWSYRTNRNVVTQGMTTSTTVQVANNGTRLRHTDASRNFSAGGDVAGAPTWTLVEDVESERRIHFNITRQGLFTATLGITDETIQNRAFHITFRNATGETWRIYIFEGGISGNLYLLTHEPGESLTRDGLWMLEACAVNKEYAHAWVTRGTFGGSECDELDFFESIDRPYTVTLNNTHVPALLSDSDRIRGKYDVLVDKPIEETNLTAYHDATDPEDRSPFAETALSSARVRTSVVSSETEFESRTTVHPTRFLGLPDGEPPEIRRFDIEDDPTLVTDVKYEVDWEVDDQDADLDSVLFVLLNETDHAVDVEEESVSGTYDSGDTTLRDGDGDSGDPYTIVLQARDKRGEKSTDATSDTADGIDP